MTKAEGGIVKNFGFYQILRPSVDHWILYIVLLTCQAMIPFNHWELTVLNAAAVNNNVNVPVDITHTFG